MRRVAINGLGRIGRLLLRQLAQVPTVQVVAVNDVADTASLAHLLTYDSIHGRAAFPVAVEADHLRVDGQHIPVSHHADPRDLPFGSLGAQLVLECTGQFTRREAAALHLQGGVARVVISAPVEQADRTVVLGINDRDLDLGRDRVISAASPAVLALAPLLQVLQEGFGMEAGFVTAVESYTPEQRILDLPHEDLRMARAASLSMIPCRTTLSHTVAQVLPVLAGRIEGLSVRVPTPDVSLLDLTALLQTEATVPALHRALVAAAQGPLAGSLAVLEAELVSADLVGQLTPSLYDPFLTRQLGPRLFKVFAWYDNEMGYAAHLKDLCLRLTQEAG